MSSYGGNMDNKQKNQNDHILDMACEKTHGRLTVLSDRTQWNSLNFMLIGKADATRKKVDVYGWAGTVL